MNTITNLELRQLATVQDRPCVSIYMPIDASGVDELRDYGVLRALVTQAATKLKEAGYGETLIDACLRPARILLEKDGLRPYRAMGLAIFLRPQQSRIFVTPINVPEVAMVGQRFYIRPLLTLLEQVAEFWLLALSQQRVRLLEVSRRELREIPVPGLPQNMEQALNEQGVDRGEQVHAGAKLGTGKEAAVFHGQGGVPDARKDQLLRFFRQVDAALKPVLAGQDVPLLLAAIDAHLPVYRAVNTYPGLLEFALTGNVDYEATPALLERAWKVAEPQLKKLVKQRLAKYADLQSHGQASADVHKVLAAAFAGKVETIFVDPTSQLWGAYHPTTARAEYHDRFAVGDDDLVDVAARETWLHGGHVFVLPRLEMPDGAAAAAIYRY